MKTNTLILISLLFFMSGCSFTSMTMKATKPLISSTFDQVMNESNPELAKSAIESHIKLLEGILVHRPRDQELLTYASMGYAAYALGYIEDDSTELAIEFYERSVKFALKGLRNYGVSEESAHGDLEKFEHIVSQLPKKAAPLLFWASLSWSLESFLSLENPNSLANLTRAEVMMKRVVELDSTYFYGAPVMYFGVIYGYRPKVLGGNPEKAMIYYENAKIISKNKFLLERVFKARYLWVPLLEEENFRSELNSVIEAPIDILPNAKWITSIAKLKAKKYLSRSSDWF